jgi:outer membrane protein assembly factor BamB
MLRFFLPLVFIASALAEDWPTLHGDLQRSGFYARFLDGKFTLVWRKELWRELTPPRAEVIIGGGVAFMGTYGGKMHAWEAATGMEKWTIETGGPIGHSPAFADGALYFGSMDRRLRAVDGASGKERWSFEASEGIWTSPCVWRGHVMFGDRAGIFYALDCATGQPAWQLQTGAPILSPASISADGERVIFVSEDMHVRCCGVNDGKLLWISPQLAGLTLRDYAPLIVGDLAVVTASPVKDFHTILGQHQEMLLKRTGFTGKDPRYIAGSDDDVRAEQDFIVAFLREHPDEQTFHAFRVSDGTEPWIAPILYTGGLHNPPSPPCMNRETGEVFVQLRSAYGTWDGGGEVRPLTCFGKLDVETGRVALIGHGYASSEPARPPGAKDMPWGAFAYIGDETQTLSCAPGRLFSNHQGSLGMLDLATGKVTNLFGKRDSYGGFYGAANFGWEDKGGYENARAAGQPYALVNEWHGPARSIASVADGRVYFHTGSQVLCLEPSEPPKK